MKKGILIPALLLGGAGAFMYFRSKKRAGENLKVDPLDIGIDSDRTKKSFFTKLYYIVKLNLINSEAASVVVKNVQLNASVNGRPLGVLTSSGSFSVPAKGSQVVALQASVSTLGAGGIILDLIKNKRNISVQIEGSVDTDLGRVNVKYTKEINLGLNGPKRFYKRRNVRYGI